MRLDLKNVYRRVAARYRKLAAETPVRRQSAPAVALREPGAGPSLQRRRSSAAKSPEPEATVAERARLKAAFSLAQERGHVPTALMLLAQGVSGRQIARAIASLSQSRGASLSARMAELPGIDIGSAPSMSDAVLKREGAAAQLQSAYDQALGRTPR